jgi:hypothetical protein
MLSPLCNREGKESIQRGDHFMMVKCDYMSKIYEQSVKEPFGDCLEGNERAGLEQ